MFIRQTSPFRFIVDVEDVFMATKKLVDQRSRDQEQGSLIKFVSFAFEFFERVNEKKEEQPMMTSQVMG